MASLARLRFPRVKSSDLLASLPLWVGLASTSTQSVSSPLGALFYLPDGYHLVQTFMPGQFQDLDRYIHMHLYELDFFMLQVLLCFITFHACLEFCSIFCL